MVFSNSSTAQGIVEQVRNMIRCDSTQWPTSRIVASANNYLDLITGYAIGADKRFQWDDTNQTALPIGTTNLVASQSDYSFLTDQQGNRILTLTRIEVLDSNGIWHNLEKIDQNDIEIALPEYQKTAGVPNQYDEIADNIIRLYPTPSASVTSGLKFYFQRAGSYFVAADTTKEPGVAILLHRGFVIASAYDAALTLGLPNIQALSIEMERETMKMIQYFADRNRDTKTRMVPMYENNK